MPQVRCVGAPPRVGDADHGLGALTGPAMPGWLVRPGAGRSRWLPLDAAGRELAVIVAQGKR
jgi:hypothetical protein